MLKAVPVLGKKKSADLCQAFIDGAPKDAEGWVLWGVNATNQGQWVQILKRGDPYFYGDNSLLDATRGTHFRFTRNALQPTGKAPGFANTDRLDALGIRLKPWIFDCDRPDTALVLEQSPDFIRILHGRQPENVVRSMLTIARQAGLRPHLRAWDPNKLNQMASFAYQLKETRRVIAFSSAGAITAAIEGVPYCVIDPRCAAALHGTQPADLAKRPTMACDEQRREWLAVLANAQWTVDELRSGLAWQMLHEPTQRRRPIEEPIALAVR